MQSNQLFNVVFHYEGEFVRLIDGVMIYRGGVSSLVTNIHIDKFTMVTLNRMLTGWGFKQGTYRAWTKIVEFDPIFFHISKDDDCYDFAAYACVTEVDGVMYVEHDVGNVSGSVRSPRCVNEIVEMDRFDDEGVEGLGDSEDERATAILDGFEGIDVTIPIRQYVSDEYGKKKVEDDDEYVSDDLESSDPDMLEDEKLPKFEKFRKEHLDKNFKFQWGMEFNSLDEFREAIRDWSVLNGRQIKFPTVPSQASQVPTEFETTQPTNYFGDITDELLSSLPDIGTSQATTAESKHGKKKEGGMCEANENEVR